MCKEEMCTPLPAKLWSELLQPEQSGTQNVAGERIQLDFWFIAIFYLKTKKLKKQKKLRYCSECSHQSCM